MPLGTVNPSTWSNWDWPTAEDLRQREDTMHKKTYNSDWGRDVPDSPEDTCVVTLTHAAIRKLASTSPEAGRKLRSQAPQAFVGEAIAFDRHMMGPDYKLAMWPNLGPLKGLWLSSDFDWSISRINMAGSPSSILVARRRKV